MSITQTQTQAATQQFRQRFQEELNAISSSQDINYYDFLIVAKKLELRFEQSSHLMALKNFFTKNKNVCNKAKLAEMLAINNKVPKSKFPNKTIIKFLVPEISFDSIRQATDEDEESMNFDNQSFLKKRKNKSLSKRYNTIEHTDKVFMVVKLKVGNTIKKIDALIKSVRQGKFFMQNNLMKQNYTYDTFKKRVFKFIQEDTVNDDDLKSLFFILDVNKDGILTKKELLQLIDPDFQMVLTDFYKTRVNPQVSQATSFKRGASINSLQMYKAKNPWTIELSDIQESIMSCHRLPQQNKRYSKPRFGPLRHYNLQKPNQSQKVIPQKSSTKQDALLLQRTKIQKLLRQSKATQRKQTNPNQTITSKLRKLFVDKVILPRQKMFQQYRSKSRRGVSRSFQIKTRNQQSFN